MSKLRKGNLDPLIKELNQGMIVSPNGAITFDGRAWDEIRTVLQTFVEFSPEIPSSLRESIVSKAIFSAGKSGKISRESLEISAAEAESEYLRKRRTEFHYLSSLSFRLPDELSSITANGLKIKGSPSGLLAF